MSFPVNGFQTIAQDHISRNVASNFYPKLPFLSALGHFTLTRNKKTPLNIGRPDGTILSGKVMSPGEALALQNFNSYIVPIDTYETDNSKMMGDRDTKPVVSSPQTRSHGQVAQTAAKFNRFRISTPLLIWWSDKKRALQKEGKLGQGIAMGQIIERAVEKGFQEHVKKLNDQIWNGNPTDDTADTMDNCAGILQAIHTTNTYGGVNRSTSTNSEWRAQRNTTRTSLDLASLIDEINLNPDNTSGRLGLGIYGNGVDLLITTPSIYSNFKAQALAKGVAMVKGEGLPKMGAFGVTKEVLQKDNAIIMYDPSCPANTVIGLTMETWRLAIAPGQNMTVTPFEKMTGEGAKEADEAFIETEAIFSCDNPKMNVVYTAIGT